MTADHSSEGEGRKCWLRVRWGKEVRKMEWHTSWKSFEKLEAKVRALFHIDKRCKLVFKYTAEEPITMSSDEEWGIALELLEGNTLFVDIEQAKQKKRKMLARAMRTVKHLKPSALAFCTSCSTYLRSVRLPAFSFPSINLRRTISPLSFYIKVAALAVILAVSLQLAIQCYESYEAYDVKILAATYGGVDVTRKTQNYYAEHNVVLASNALYGDPLPGHTKYLHLIYEHEGTLYKQVVSESGPRTSLYLDSPVYQPQCDYSPAGFASGRPITVLAAFYDSNDVTCRANKLLNTGSFVYSSNYWPVEHTDQIRPENFGVLRNGGGGFTMFYYKDNELKVFTGYDGTKVKF